MYVTDAVAEHLGARQEKFALYSPSRADRRGDRGLPVESRLGLRLRFGASVVHLDFLDLCFRFRQSVLTINFDGQMAEVCGRENLGASNNLRETKSSN